MLTRPPPYTTADAGEMKSWITERSPPMSEDGLRSSFIYARTPSDCTQVQQAKQVAA